MTDVKKRHDDRLQPNKEQVRLAQSQTKDDHALQKLIKRVFVLLSTFKFIAFIYHLGDRGYRL